MFKTIYIFGNPLLEFDSLPLRLLPSLQKAFPALDFLVVDPNENLKPVNKELAIIDTVINTDKIFVLEDINKIETDSPYSLHDFDLAMNLKLLFKLGELKKVTIFCLPPNGNKDEILADLISHLAEYIRSK